MSKQPKSKEFISRRKESTNIKNPEGYQNQIIGWHFQYMDTEGEWCCTISELKDIMHVLHKYENMTWSDAVKMSHTHPMPVGRINKRAKNRLDKLGFVDIATIYQLSIHNGQKRRLWGFRIENIFQILWWDPDHTIYQMKR